MRRRPALLIVLPLAAVLLSGCAGAAPEASSGEPTGRWGSTDDDEPHIEFLEDGTVLSHDGCNGGGGRWSQDDASAAVEVGGSSSTFVACPGDQPLLAGTDTAIVDGDRIHLLDEAGEVIEVLRRSS
ncbi:META domain-containing protein [Arenivirga flava]|uniref:DUF306 domain-containing protein n=1 Tax=Arenivirga flava TaxID=1930060 RepID=A0AA37UP95_9MICO|nr:META domain-containing protein [Arenivirga flava]GMA28656.1 hypothetical protein GCM10025874_19090 [Arenivirga flava]